MPNKILRLYSFLKHWLQAVDKHSLQAPFIYDLYTKVIRTPTDQSLFLEIEDIKKSFVKSKAIIKVNDFGAGSQVSHQSERKVSQIAKNGITKSKYSQMLYRLAEYMNAKNIIELGTSLGVNTLYLSSINRSKVQVTTFEGAKELAKISRSVFEQAKRKNITLIEGDIDITLPLFLDSAPKIDFVFFDANHQFTPTTTYFELLALHAHNQTCFIFDDIHWSHGMEKAWNAIRKKDMVTLSIDVFQFGLIFFNKDLRKQHYVLEF